MLQLEFWKKIDWLFYSYCASHRLNFCVVSACKIQNVKNMIDNVENISKFFKASSTPRISGKATSSSRVISRGVQEAVSLLLQFLCSFWGAQPPYTSCIDLAFQSLLSLLPKCYD